jgi:multidrug efflux system membrane fusion protein
LIAALATLAGCTLTPAAPTAAAGTSAPPAVPVKVARAESRTIPVEIAAIGNVEPHSTISVKAQIGGALLKVHFTEGDMVNKDQALFEIDPRPYEEAIRLAEANLARDRALLA